MKINKQTFDFIKISLNAGITNGMLINDFKISISTLRKINNAGSFKEYQGFIKITPNDIRSNYDFKIDINQIYGYKKPKFSILRTIKNLLHLK